MMGPAVPLVPEMIEDICSHNEEDLRAYCFCCPSLRVDEFRLLYTIPLGSDASPEVSANGKSAQDIFGECILQKNKGEKFINEAPAGTYHSADQLRAFLIRSAAKAVSHINYAELEPSENMQWLANMPTNEEAGWGADAANDKALNPTPASLDAAVVEADQAISGWKDVKRNVTVHLPEGQVARQTNPDGTLLTLPSLKADRPVREGLQLDPTAGRTEHVMIINRQAQHVGWSGRAQNQFAALAGPAAPPPPAMAEDPSEVGPNA
jgi:hypothetical protein